MSDSPAHRPTPVGARLFTRMAAVDGVVVHMTVFMYEDGQPCEIHVNVTRGDRSISGFTDAIREFFRAFSMLLQHGVPLPVLVNKFAGVRFEPNGRTNDINVPAAASVIDFVVRWLGIRFSAEDDMEVPAAQHVTEAAFGEPCESCGNTTEVKDGLFMCPSCGARRNIEVIVDNAVGC
jgi:ribonucleoside-diphosphate reductase alpha chain